MIPSIFNLFGWSVKLSTVVISALEGQLCVSGHINGRVKSSSQQHGHMQKNTLGENKYTHMEIYHCYIIYIDRYNEQQ
jgi:hypothetical protein